MRRSHPVICLLLGVTYLFAPTIGGLTAPTPVLARAAVREAPFGDNAGALAVNYTRLKPHIATAGLLNNGAIPVLKALGFATIVDLRGPAEGAGGEKQAAEAAGLRYVNIPVTGGIPTDAQVAEFARVIEDPNNAPLLVHCASANRVGAMSTLYRVRQGIPLAIALEEGRTAGLRPDREAALRAISGFVGDAEPGVLFDTPLTGVFVADDGVAAIRFDELGRTPRPPLRVSAVPSLRGCSR